MFLENEQNECLILLKNKGIDLYLNNYDGDIYYRLSTNESFIHAKSPRKLENILKNILNRKVDLSCFYNNNSKKDEEEHDLVISVEDLKLVTNEVFDPSWKQEFILQEDNRYKLNKFKPSYYMQLNENLEQVNPVNLSSAIIKLIIHLANGDKQRAVWIINWLAYFFQRLKKSQVALVLLGVQGAGKGIFFNEIIKPLFGEKFVKTINDKSLNTNYKGALVENTLFFNLDEISANKNSSSSIKNFLKALVTNESITIEKKFKNLEKETLIHGQILITSNELYVLEIEPTDRRFTVFSTGESLSNCNFLGFGNHEYLSKAIKSELESFAIFLKKFSLDEKNANTALNTLEKNELISKYQIEQQKNILKAKPKSIKLEENLKEFRNAIKFRNFSFFDSIVDFDKQRLKNEIIFDLHHNIFRIDNLLPTFKTVYGGRSFSTNSEFLRKLQEIEPLLFSSINCKDCSIDEEIKKVFLLSYHNFLGL